MPSTAPSPDTSQDKKEKTTFRRSRSGCLTCRSRRVKCDEGHPVCNRCQRVDAQCAWPNSYDPLHSLLQAAGQQSYTSHPNKRSRLGSRLPACVACRHAKSKCSHNPPTCTRCAQQGIKCSWPDEGSIDGEKMPQISPKSAPHPPSRINDVLASGQELRILISTYFTFVHPVQGMTFLPRDQIWRDIEDSVASRLLVKSMCAVSARFLDRSDSQSADGGGLAEVWAQEVKGELMANTERISMSKLASVLCLIHHEYNCGRLLSAWMFMAIAARLALAMGLDKKRPTIRDTGKKASWVTEETARRLMWTTLSFDVLGSSAFEKYTLIHQSPDIDLPCSDDMFNAGVTPTGKGMTMYEMEQAIPLAISSDACDGVMGRWVRLMAIRRDVLSYAKDAGDYDVKPWEPGSIFWKLDNRLQAWAASLPANLAFTFVNLKSLPDDGHVGGLTGLHLLYDLVVLSLNRIAFPQDDSRNLHASTTGAPFEWVKRCRQTAYHQALTVRSRIRDIEDHFPDLIPTSRLWTRSVLGSVTAQLDFLQCCDASAPRESDNETLWGFQSLVRTVHRMTKYFSAEKRLLKEILSILARRGYNLYGLTDSTALATRPGSPSFVASVTTELKQPSVLDDIPWMRRALVQAEVEDVGHRANEESNLRSTSQMDNMDQTIRPTALSSIIPSGFASFEQSVPHIQTSDVLSDTPADIRQLPLDDSFLHQTDGSLINLWTQFQPDPHLQLTNDLSDLERFFDLPDGWS